MNWKLTLVVSAMMISICRGAEKQPKIESGSSATTGAPTNLFSNWTTASANLSVRSATTPWGRSKSGQFVIKADPQNDPALTKLRLQLRGDLSKRREDIERQERLLTGPPLSEMYGVRLSPHTKTAAPKP